MNNRGYNSSAMLYLHNTKTVKVAHLVELELPTIGGSSVNGYFTDYGSPVVYNGRTYITNRIKSISDIRDTTGIRLDKVTIEVFGVWEDELARALKEPTDLSYTHKDIKIYRAYLDKSTGEVISTDVAGGPSLYFKGLITDISLKESPTGGTSVVSWSVSNHFVAFEKVTGRLGNDASHRGLVTVETSPGIFEEIPDSTVARKPSHISDLGFMHAETAIDVEAQYKATEKRYKTKKRGGLAGLVGMERLIEYDAVVTREMDVRFNLSAAYLPKVYGVQRLSVTPVFVGIDSSDPDQVYAVYTICEGEIKGILNFYLDNKTIVCGNGDSTDEEGTTICLGNQRNGDTIETVAIGGSGGVGDPTIHGTKYLIEDESGNLDITVYHGTPDQTADPDLVNIAANQKFLLQGNKSGEEYWGSNHRLLDTAYIVVRSQLTEDRTELPEIEVVVEGGNVKTWDSSDLSINGGQSNFTQNLAWYLLDYMTSDSGGQLELSDIDIESFYNTAKILDQEDTSYDISWCPYWRYLGWNTLDTTYTDSFGNTIPYRTKYQANAIINTDESVFSNISAMLTQVNASLNYTGGKYTLSVEADHDVTPNALGEETVIDWTECIGQIVSKNDTANKIYNTVDAKIVDPGLGFSKNSVVFFNSVYKEADNNIEKKGRFSFPYITNYYTARTLTSQLLERSRYSREFTITTYFKYSYLQVNDTVKFNYPRFFGSEPKKLLVSGVVNKKSGLVELTLKDYDPSVYVPKDQTDKGSLQIPPVMGIRAPTNLEILTNWTVSEPDNTSLMLLFSPSASSPVLRYEVRWSIGPTGQAADQIQTAYDVLPTQMTGGKVYSFLTGIQPRDDNWTIKVDVRTVSSNGQFSTWVSKTLSSTEALLPTRLPEVSNFRVLNSVPGTNNQFFGPDIQLAWDGQSEQTTNFEIIFYNPANEGQEYSQWITTPSVTYDLETFNYTVQNNLADFTAVNGTSGIFRNIGIKIRARANPNLVDGKQTGAYATEGFGPWAYIEI